MPDVHAVFSRIIRTVLRKTQRTPSPKMAHFTRHARSTFSTSHARTHTHTHTCLLTANIESSRLQRDSVVMLGSDSAELSGWCLLRVEEREEVIGVASVNRE